MTPGLAKLNLLLLEINTELKARKQVYYPAVAIWAGILGYMYWDGVTLEGSVWHAFKVLAFAIGSGVALFAYARGISWEPESKAFPNGVNRDQYLRGKCLRLCQGCTMNEYQEIFHLLNSARVPKSKALELVKSIMLANPQFWENCAKENRINSKD